MEFGLSESPKKTSRSQEGLIVNNSQVSDNEPCEHLKGRGRRRCSTPRQHFEPGLRVLTPNSCWVKVHVMFLLGKEIQLHRC